MIRNKKPLILVVGVVALLAGGAKTHASASIESFNFDSLSGKDFSVEEAMLLLPESIRKNFLLLPFTRSQDRATYLKPRMILFNDDATQIVAVSGDGQGPRGNFIEVLEFDSEKRVFKPTEIQFGRSGGIRVDHSPQACIACHSTLASIHPLWDSYSIWIDAYGSVDHRPHLPGNSIEEMRFREFKRIAQESPRFKTLIGLAHVTLVDASSSSLATKNTNFSIAVQRLNAQRIFARLEPVLDANPAYWIPLLSVTMSRKVELFLPGADTSKVASRLAELKAPVIRSMQEEYDRKLAKLQERGACALPWKNFDLEYAEEIARLRLLIEDGLGQSMSDWSLTGGPFRYEFADGLHGLILSHLQQETLGYIRNNRRRMPGLHGLARPEQGEEESIDVLPLRDWQREIGYKFVSRGVTQLDRLGQTATPCSRMLVPARDQNQSASMREQKASATILTR